MLLHNARRIGDRNQKGDEKVKEYNLTPDGKICETIWEPVPVVRSVSTISRCCNNYCDDWDCGDSECPICQT